MKMNCKSTTAKKLTVSYVIILALSLCLAVTTLALVYSMVSVEDNLFTTGTVKINLNNGEPIIREDEFVFEPGMTVKKEFSVKNESSCDVFYKLYFQNIGGGLSDILQVQICDGDKVLYEGTPKELNRENVIAADDILIVGEQRELQIFFHFPEETDNEAQNMYFSFDFASDAVQVKNNTDKLFY